MSQLRTTVILAVSIFMIVWIFVFYHHETNHQLFPHINTQNSKILPTANNQLRSGKPINNPSLQQMQENLKMKERIMKKLLNSSGSSNKKDYMKFLPDLVDVNKEIEAVTEATVNEARRHGNKRAQVAAPVLPHAITETLTKEEEEKLKKAASEDLNDLIEMKKHQAENGKGVSAVNGDEKKESNYYRYGASKGILVCNGERVDSEIIYWKTVPHDIDFESPITPHHGIHDDKYLTFEYDQGGWNNVRMGVESLIVVAHAMGRTLVIPPQQHLYLLGAMHKDPHDKDSHDEMGFEDFFDINLLRSHRGFHVMNMEEFLAKEGVSGGLHGVLPPQNSTKVWGQALWSYLNKVADAKPEWTGRYVAFPSHSGDFNLAELTNNSKAQKRIKEFGGDRSPVYYDRQLQEAHHIHFPARERHRLLQHHYAFAFFVDEKMQSFYRRFVRDFMRYKDSIQCAGAELVAAVRADARKHAPSFGGDYYALHIRRGDFQYKDVKLSAKEILDTLRFPNGTWIIPTGALVYISTDDPDGLCKNCMVNRQPCETYHTPKPPGCPEDTSWNAFLQAGWKIRFLRDYQKAGYIPHANPNTLGMIESIVCSRAKVFAGTYYSTFTGYIHRLRGYHGLGESTYYHSKNFVFSLQKTKSVGHGFSREWRAGWTDDEGQLI